MVQGCDCKLNRKAISGGVGMQPDIIHSDDFEAIFGLYRSENMGFQSRSNDDGGRDRNLRPQKPADGSPPARQNLNQNNISLVLQALSTEFLRL